MDRLMLLEWTVSDAGVAARVLLIGPDGAAVEAEMHVHPSDALRMDLVPAERAIKREVAGLLATLTREG